MTAAVDRFESRIAKDSTAGCWRWAGAIHSVTGYGAFSVGRRSFLAHRWSYLHYVGPIPPGLQLDHLCRDRACVNPAHLEPVTARVNTLRGLTVSAANSAKTHCPQRHEYTGFNILRKRGRRYCRTCWNDAQRRRHSAKRGAS